MKLGRILPIASVLLLMQCGGEARPTQGAQVAPLASAPPPARTYVVRMHRASRVGDRTHAVVDDDRREQITTRLLGQPPTKTDKPTHAHLDATIVVQEIDDRQNSRRSEIAVNELWQTTGTGASAGARVVLAPAGAHVMVTRAARKEDAQMTVNGQPASKELREAIDGLLTLSIGGPSDDEIFGTMDSQAVGAEWSPNVAVAQKDLTEKGIVAKEGGVSGKVKLVGIEHVGGVECLDLQADITVAGIQSVGDLPQGAIVESGTVNAHMRGLFPLDDKLGRLREEMEISTRMKVRVPSPQGDVQVDVKTVDRRHASYSPL